MRSIVIISVQLLRFWGAVVSFAGVNEVSKGAEGQALSDQYTERCAADSLATCLRLIGVKPAVIRNVEHEKALHSANATLEDCRSFALRHGISTVGFRWSSVPESWSLRGVPAIVPVALPNGRGHFVAAVAARPGKLLIVDYPHHPRWVSSRELVNKWRWDGTMLHISKDPIAIRSLTSLAGQKTYSRSVYGFGIFGIAAVALLWGRARFREMTQREGNHRPSSRSGVAMIEILLVLGIISILAAVILPAVQSVRESARNATCKSRLHQIGIALEAFNATHGRLPAAAVSASNVTGLPYAYNIAPHVELLPYLDQKSLYDRFDRDETGSGVNFDPPVSRTNGKVLSHGLSVFSCPSDSADIPSCNYRISAGTSPWMHETTPKSPNGALQGYRSLLGRRDAEFHDGKSHTAAFAEKLSGDRDHNHYTAWRDLVSIRGGGVGLATPNDVLFACARPTDSNPTHFSFGGTTWALSGYPQTWYNHVLTPNSPIPDCVDGGPMGHGAFSTRALHPFGVNVLFADGSIRFTADSIDLNVWRALGSIAGGELVSHDEL